MNDNDILEAQNFHVLSDRLSSDAYQRKCHIYIDAEQTYMQEAIDAAARLN
jgi:hypothetical protein